MKQTIRLRKSELKKMISETINRELNEVYVGGVSLHGYEEGYKDPKKAAVPNWFVASELRRLKAQRALNKMDIEDLDKQKRARKTDIDHALEDMGDDKNIVPALRSGSNKFDIIKSNLGLEELDEKINRIVRQVLKEGRMSSMDSFERASQPVTVQTPEGIITFQRPSDYKKWKREQQKKNGNGGGTKRTGPILKTGNELAPNQLHARIEKLIKSAAPLESLYTFKEHAYRSYGNIAREIMQPFAEEYRLFSIAYRKIRESLAKIKKYGKANEYETYDEARKLTYNIEEMQIALVQLCDAVKARRKEIKRQYGETAIYNGRADKQNPNIKKELGFVDQLFSKSAKIIDTTISNLQSAAEEIASIADKGRNPLSYDVDRI